MQPKRQLIKLKKCNNFPVVIISENGKMRIEYVSDSKYTDEQIEKAVYDQLTETLNTI